MCGNSLWRSFAQLRNGDERLIRCLVLLAGAYGQRGVSPQRSLRVSQERLGTMLALSRQTVNALMQDLERDHLIVCVRGGVRILDQPRLLALQTPSPSLALPPPDRHSAVWWMQRGGRAGFLRRL